MTDMPSDPIPDPNPEPTPAPTPGRSINPRVALLAGLVVVGSLAFGLWPEGNGVRATVSFLGGATLAGTLLFGGIAAVALFASVANGLSLIVALMTYTTTVAAFAAVLAASDPDVVDGPAFAVGLLLLGGAATYRQWRLSQKAIPPPPVHGEN